MNRYLLDANVFIEAKNHHYGMDFCPGFWDWLIASQGKGSVFSIKAVCDELVQDESDGEEEDELSKWVKAAGSCLFLPHDQPMADQLTAVATWANSQRYVPAAVATFLGCADMHIVAYAKAHGCIVVTHEKSSDSTFKLKVPDACRGLGVKCIRPYEMLRAENAKFVMQSTGGGGISGLDALKH